LIVAMKLVASNDGAGFAVAVAGAALGEAVDAPPHAAATNAVASPIAMTLWMDRIRPSSSS
jgi:hypothetical protein